MGFADEKTLVIVSFVIALFVAINVDPQIGIVTFAMAASYGFAVNSKKAMEFIRSSKDIGRNIAIGSIAIGIYLFGISALFSVQPLSVFASTFSFAFTTADPLIKFLIFGIAVPLFETLFFLLVAFPQIQKFVKINGNLFGQNLQVYVASGVTGLLVAVFHLTVRFWNPEAFMVDFAFFALSALIVAKFKEGQQAFVMHAIINSYVVSKVSGLL